MRKEILCHNKVTSQVSAIRCFFIVYSAAEYGSRINFILNKMIRETGALQSI
jgi:hypothetical protein